MKYHVTKSEIIIGNEYWTYSIVYFPVKVKVIAIDDEIVKTDKGDLHISKLYRREAECPQR